MTMYPIQAYRISEGAIAVTGMLVNTLVLVALWKNKQLHTPGNVFIAHLCVADVCVGLLVAPLSTVTTGEIEHTNLRMDFMSCNFLISLVNLFNNANVIMLFCVTLERFFAIRFPLLYRKHTGVKNNMLYATFAWVVGIVLAFIPMYGWHANIENYKGKCHYKAVVARSYMVYKEALIMFLVPIVTMTCTYTYIWSVVKHHQKIDVIVSTKLGRVVTTSRHSKIPFLKVCLVFFMLRFPLHAYDVMVYYDIGKGIPDSLMFDLLLVSICLKRVNSVVNPFIYAGTNRKIREAVLSIVYCRRQVDEDENIFATYTAKSNTSVFKSQRSLANILKSNKKISLTSEGNSKYGFVSTATIDCTRESSRSDTIARKSPRSNPISGKSSKSNTTSRKTSKTMLNNTHPVDLGSESPRNSH